MRTLLLLLSFLVLLAAPPPCVQAQPQSDSTYTVQSGDTLYSISRRFGVSVQALQRWNDLQDSTLRVGQTLRVRAPTETTPQPPPEPDSLAPPSDSARTPEAISDTAAAVSVDPPPAGRYGATEGDTFVSLALRLGTTVDTLFSLNERRTEPLSPGDTVRLPPRFGPPTHLVQRGETLFTIAGEYGVSVRALRAANGLDTNAVEPGRRLRLPGRTAPDLPAPGDWAPPDSTGRIAVYPSTFAGRLTAGGTVYDPNDFAVSHPSAPYGSVVLLSSLSSDRQVFARVIDRGPLEEGVLLDVSEAVAEQLAYGENASPTVALRVLWRPPAAQ